MYHCPISSRSIAAANSAMHMKSDLPRRRTGSSIGSQTPDSVSTARLSARVRVSPSSEVTLTVFFTPRPQVISCTPLTRSEGTEALCAVYHNSRRPDYARDLGAVAHYNGALGAVDKFRPGSLNALESFRERFSARHYDISAHKNTPETTFRGLFYVYLRELFSLRRSESFHYPHGGLYSVHRR